MLPLAAAVAGFSLILGGVTVQASGVTTVMPMAPDPAHPEVLYSTTSITPNTSVLMADNSRWLVTDKRRAGAAWRVMLAPLGQNGILGIFVPLAAADTPIWWVGDVTEVINDPRDQPVPTDPPPPPGENP
jgi:hypothetical protein